MIIAIVTTRELKPKAIRTFSHINSYSSLKQTCSSNQTLGQGWREEADVIHYHCYNESPLSTTHSLSNAAWRQGPQASSGRWQKGKVEIRSLCRVLIAVFFTCIYHIIWYLGRFTEHEGSFVLETAEYNRSLMERPLCLAQRVTVVIS